MLCNVIMSAGDWVSCVWSSEQFIAVIHVTATHLVPITESLRSTDLTNLTRTLNGRDGTTRHDEAVLVVMVQSTWYTGCQSNTGDTKRSLLTCWSVIGLDDASCYVTFDVWHQPNTVNNKPLLTMSSQQHKVCVEHDWFKLKFDS